MAILIANDDGIHAQGLKALIDALTGLDEIYVVAPDREQSATSHSLTLHRPLRIKEINSHTFAIDGTPTDCVLLAVRKILPERPKLVISGINHGANLGDDVTYSGTVSAALEGAVMGIPAVAVSLVARKEFQFDYAARFSRVLAEQILKNGLPKGVYLNVNVPGDLVGFAPTTQAPLTYAVTHTGKRDYGSVVVEKTDPRDRKYYWIGGDPEGFERRPGTDCEAVVNHCISVTPLQVDVTHYLFMEELRHWELDGFRHRISDPS